MLEPPSGLLGDWGGSVWIVDAFCGSWRDVVALSQARIGAENGRTVAVLTFGLWIIRGDDGQALV